MNSDFRKEGRMKMVIVTRSDILKENNKLFIQVSITDNQKEYLTNMIVYGENPEEILEKYHKIKQKYERR